VSFWSSRAASAKTSRVFAVLLLFLVARLEETFSIAAFFAPARGRPFGQPRFFGPSDRSLMMTLLVVEVATISSGGVWV
jgi:hypothetical protein